VRVAVAGGTGLVGKLVVAAVRAGGHEPIVLARSCGVDLTTGEGLDDALAGSDVIVDVSNVTTTSRRVWVAFFEAGTRELLSAGQRLGVRHHVALSIVGVDRVNFPYYEGKRRQEALLLEDSGRTSVLRCTQLHEFAGQLLRRMRGPIVPVPRMRSQPIAATEAAAALLEAVTGEPMGLMADLAGPEVLEMTDCVRQLVRAARLRRVVIPVRLPGAAGRKMAGGALLPTEPGPRGKQTFAEWLQLQQPFH